MTDEKPKEWSQTKFMLIGLAIGGVLWVFGGDGPTLDDIQVVLFPAVVGMLIAWWHNRRHQVGPYDPETIERNKRGTL